MTDRIAGSHVADFGDGVPRGNAGAGQRRGFLIGKVRGNGHHAVFAQNNQFGEHAVDIAAQRAFDLRGVGLAVNPVLHKDAGHAIAGLDARNAFADSDHFARAVGAGDAGQTHVRVVAALDHHEVAIIERDGVNTQEDFAALRHGIGQRDALEVVDAELRNAPGFHALKDARRRASDAALLWCAGTELWCVGTRRHRSYHGTMARGWESKSVEDQVEQRAAEISAGSDGASRKPETNAARAARLREQEALELQRERILDERTSSPIRRKALEAALAEIEAKLAQL